ncbi:MAG: Unknown protein [uncultured Sulfurovum sp.]|uniref:Uncharacterized protein n=1 Tax=uncultured Sulfurovum sp. TaxID=269237 RepID=A0A6S6SAT1_9BACT|nr:MAG: Unknown protein [uncultured Sulfurovum sp.]
MKKIVFTIASRRLEVDLEDDFAQYVSNDLLKNKIIIDRDNDISQLLQLYLKSIHKEFHSEEQITTLLNQMKGSN